MADLSFLDGECNGYFYQSFSMLVVHTTIQV